MIFLLGLLLFLFTAMDITKTTLSTRGGGLLTNAVARSVRACFFVAAGRRGESRLLEYSGQCVLLAVLASWILALWASLFLVLASSPGSVISSNTRMPADLLETLYYAGFTLSTLGVGDYVAAGDGWRVLSSAAAFCGLTFITAAITYIVPVLSAVNLQNQLGLLINSLGRSPQELLINSWNGADFSGFYNNADKLRELLVQHTLNHHAYPVIHCFHNCDAQRSVVPALVILDEAVRMLESLPPEVPQNSLKRRMLRKALDRHIEMLQSHPADPQAGRAEPPADLAPLKAAGIPIDESAYRQCEQAAAARREALGALLVGDGWNWRHIYRQAAAPG
ncbi:potassium channel family protein [Stutzerimonas balearica]|uniref:potassium channel family protein n=1 Tax=Stutzerimonas balearica TaxID=74829 RepID=UPI001BAFE872|nr:potassium channel family protein [Stutzerimonas balearica]WAN10828.1 potassium channel family protein [Stutzerimonas balearica]